MLAPRRTCRAGGPGRECSSACRVGQIIMKMMRRALSSFRFQPVAESWVSVAARRGTIAGDGEQLVSLFNMGSNVTTAQQVGEASRYASRWELYRVMLQHKHWWVTDPLQMLPKLDVGAKGFLAYTSKNAFASSAYHGGRPREEVETANIRRVSGRELARLLREHCLPIKGDQYKPVLGFDDKLEHGTVVLTQGDDLRDFLRMADSLELEEVLPAVASGIPSLLSSPAKFYTLVRQEEGQGPEFMSYCEPDAIGFYTSIDKCIREAPSDLEWKDQVGDHGWWFSQLTKEDILRNFDGDTFEVGKFYLVHGGDDHQSIKFESRERLEDFFVGLHAPHLL